MKRSKITDQTSKNHFVPTFKFSITSKQRIADEIKLGFLSF